MRRYEAYFFDLYGTLVDIHTVEDHPGFWKALCGALAEFGGQNIPEPKKLQARYLDLVQENERAISRTAGPNAKVEIELRHVFSRILSEADISPAAETVEALALRFRELSTSHLRLYAGAKELLSALRGQGSRVILLSNAQSCFTLPELRRLGLEDCFDQIIISSDIGFRKPDPRIYQAALQAARLQPEDCLMIGNDPECDILGAVNAGLDAFYIRSALTPRSAPGASELPAVGNLPGMDLRTLRKILSQTEEAE